MGKISQSRHGHWNQMSHYTDHLYMCMCVRKRECGWIEIMEVNMKTGICSTAEIIWYEHHALIDGCAKVALLLYITRSVWEHCFPEGPTLCLHHSLPHMKQDVLGQFPTWLNRIMWHHIFLLLCCCRFSCLFWSVFGAGDTAVILSGIRVDFPRLHQRRVSRETNTFAQVLWSTHITVHWCSDNRRVGHNYTQTDFLLLLQWPVLFLYY